MPVSHHIFFTELARLPSCIGIFGAPIFLSDSSVGRLISGAVDVVNCGVSRWFHTLVLLIFGLFHVTLSTIAM